MTARPTTRSKMPACWEKSSANNMVGLHFSESDEARLVRHAAPVIPGAPPISATSTVPLGNRNGHGRRCFVGKKEKPGGQRRSLLTPGALHWAEVRRLEPPLSSWKPAEKPLTHRQ